jgi:hypothetical protein
MDGVITVGEGGYKSKFGFLDFLLPSAVMMQQEGLQQARHGGSQL